MKQNISGSSGAGRTNRYHPGMQFEDLPEKEKAALEQEIRWYRRHFKKQLVPGETGAATLASGKTYRCKRNRASGAEYASSPEANLVDFLNTMMARTAILLILGQVVSHIPHAMNGLRLLDVFGH